MRDLVRLLQETTLLSSIERSGFKFLGRGNQSVAEHSFQTAWVAMALAKIVQSPVNLLRLLQICLSHDLLEGRTGDLNYVNKRYLEVDHSKLLEDFKAGGLLHEDVSNLINEYEKNESIEARLAHDADKIELILTLKKEVDLGNPKATDWIERLKTRLITSEAKSLANAITDEHFDSWWQNLQQAETVKK